MSIAVSVQIKPSRFLRVLAYVACVLVVVMGISVAAEWCGNFSPTSRWSIFATSIICALFAILQFRARQMVYRLDISGNGEILLAHGANVSPARLSDGSTLWPFVLLLALVTEDGKRHRLMVLPDSIESGMYYRLSVALRWIAIRNPEDEESHFTQDPSKVY